MSKVVSKGMLALRLSNSRGEKIVQDGETFFFKKLTIDMEEQLDKIAKSNQDNGMKAPEPLKEDASPEEVRAFEEALTEFRQETARSFRKVTAEIMKYVLLDEKDNVLFDPDDDVYSLLNNIYAEKFFKAYMKFRQGVEAGPAEAERRFQN